MSDAIATILQEAGRERVIINHAAGASDDGRLALLKIRLFGDGTETYALLANLAYWLVDCLGQAVAAGAIKDRRSDAAAGSPEAQQIALYGEARPEIAPADWSAASHHIVTELRAHAFGNALGLQAILADGAEALLILPGQVAILLLESLTLVAMYLVDRAHPPRSRSEH
ncbi:MAG: hypothetical protein ACREEP_02115 [Dongiaceae bacterium]